MDGFTVNSSTINHFWKIVQEEDQIREDFNKAYKLEEVLDNKIKIMNDFKFIIRKSQINDGDPYIVDCAWELVLADYQNNDEGRAKLKHDLKRMLDDKCF